MHPQEKLHPDLPPDTLTAWRIRLPRFSPMIEGGPGKTQWLLLQFVLAIFLLWQGMRSMERQGIDSWGPALFLLAVCWIGFLMLWLLIKAIARDLEAVAYVSGKGIGLLPSRSQTVQDRVMTGLSKLVFLLTFKGGQWSAWKPFVPWRRIRSIGISESSTAIVVKGGEWNIRLSDFPDGTEALLALLAKYAKPRVFGK